MCDVCHVFCICVDEKFQERSLDEMLDVELKQG